MIEIVTLETPSLGDRSYLITDGDVAVVIDPQRDIERVLTAAAVRHVEITHVFETHIHNDYVSGGRAVADAVGAQYCVAAADTVDFTRCGIGDGDRIVTGELTIDVIATPGHTPSHLSYCLEHRGRTVAAFTGGSLLHGAVGRTDLIDAASTRALAHAQFRSARRLAAHLPDHTELYPTHGFSSFCASTSTTAGESTVGHERSANPVLRAADAESFVDQLLAGFGAVPRYYAHMAGLNRSGAAPPTFTKPKRARAADISYRLRLGEWVVDGRPRRDFAADHVAGTLNVELGEQFATTVGWAMPWGAALSLVAESPGHVAAARHNLAGIGIDQIGAVALGPLDEWAADLERRSYPVASFADVADAAPQPRVLDVRRPDEVVTGRLAGALAIPFWELESRVHELPDEEIWVHCASGFRAGFAASMLDRAGHRVVLIDDVFTRR